MSIHSVSAVREVEGVDVSTEIGLVNDSFVLETGVHGDLNRKDPENRLFLCLAASDRLNLKVNVIRSQRGLCDIIEIAAIGGESCEALRDALVVAGAKLIGAYPA